MENGPGRTGRDNREAPARMFPEEWSQNPLLPRLLDQARQRFHRHFQDGRYHGTMVNRGKPGYLVAMSPLPRFFPRSLFVAFYLSGAAWILFVAVILPCRSEPLSLRISAKLVGLFLFAIGVPTFIVLVGGFYALKDHEGVAIENLGQQLETSLRSVDERFSEERTRYQKFFNAFVERLSRRFDAGNPGFFSRIRGPLLRVIGSGTAFVVNREGRTVFLPGAAEEAAAGMSIFPKLGQNILTCMNPPEKRDASLLTATIVDDVSNLTGVPLLVNAVQNLGKLWPMELFTRKVFLFVKTFLDDRGSEEFLFFAMVPAIDLETRYLRSCRDRFRRHPEFGLDLHSLSIQDAGAPRILDPVQAGDRPARATRKIARDLLGRSVVRSVIRMADGDHLWVGIKGNNLVLSMLIGDTSLGPMRRQLDRLWGFLLLVAGLVFASTMYIGRLLSGQFLVPIRDIGEGIGAIRRKEFEFQVAVHAPDELGELAAQFNRMMESLGEMNTARLVQDRLLPRDTLEIGEYQVAGLSRAASELGGDYFDYFPLGPDRLLLVVGDVTGHGIPAALGMAIAKGLVTNHAATGAPVPDLLVALNRVLHATSAMDERMRPPRQEGATPGGATPQSRKNPLLMTMVAVELRLETHELTLTNCGHPFPFRQGSLGPPVIVELQGAMTGIRPTIRLYPQTLVLNPGERLIFYSDGMAETLAMPGTSGFDQLGRFLGTRPRLSPADACRDFLDHHPFLATGRPQPDDMTVVVLARKGPSKEGL